MRPLIWGEHHRVAVVPLEGEPRVDDLLLFKHTVNGGERNVVHRLVEIRQQDGVPLYITRGDNCLNTETVRRSQIMGRVAEVHRLSGFRPWHAIPRRMFAVTDKAYQRYSHFWAAVWPVRRLYYLMRAHLRGVRARMHGVWQRK